MVLKKGPNGIQTENLVFFCQQVWRKWGSLCAGKRYAVKAVIQNKKYILKNGRTAVQQILNGTILLVDGIQLFLPAIKPIINGLYGIKNFAEGAGTIQKDQTSVILIRIETTFFSNDDDYGTVFQIWGDRKLIFFGNIEMIGLK